MRNMPTDAWTYKDFVTGKPRWTLGKFSGWTESSGPLGVKYAIFERKISTIFVPRYCLSVESLRRIERSEGEGT